MACQVSQVLVNLPALLTLGPLTWLSVSLKSPSHVSIGRAMALKPDKDKGSDALAGDDTNATNATTISCFLQAGDFSCSLFLFHVVFITLSY